MPGTASRPYNSVKVQMEYQGKQFTVLQCSRRKRWQQVIENAAAFG
jgi:hypothetical protein